MQPSRRRSYLITLPTTEKQRIAMRNALYRLGAKEILPGLYLVSLSESERASLTQRFGGRRIRAQ